MGVVGVDHDVHHVARGPFVTEDRLDLHLVGFAVPGPHADVQEPVVVEHADLRALAGLDHVTGGTLVELAYDLGRLPGRIVETPIHLHGSGLHACRPNLPRPLLERPDPLLARERGGRVASRGRPVLAVSRQHAKRPCADGKGDRDAGRDTAIPRD